MNELELTSLRYANFENTVALAVDGTGFFSEILNLPINSINQTIVISRMYALGVWQDSSAGFASYNINSILSAAINKPQFRNLDNTNSNPIIFPNFMNQNGGLGIIVTLPSDKILPIQISLAGGDIAALIGITPAAGDQMFSRIFLSYFDIML